MNFYKLIFIMVMLNGTMIIAPPVNQQNNTVSEQKDDLEDVMEYHRYLKEVINALESDQDFRNKLEKAEESDIRSGKIAEELEFVSHHVRTKLDEIKRSEIERLRHLVLEKQNLEDGLDTNHLKFQHHVNKEHIDHSNPHTFEINDLKKLIAKTSHDLAEADRKRREEFKQYEMQKEFEKQEKLKALDEEKRVELENQLKMMEQKHKQHPKLHHPGSKKQLEEVWEKQDHMEQQQFDPRTFFMMHDLDGNGFWDQNEVNTLFLKELDKLYTKGAPEDDMRERVEEMERMREHVFNEADLNKDGLISFEEFLMQTRKPDFERDEGWNGLDEQTVYTPEEYQEFERRRQEEIQRLIAQGILPAHPAYAGGQPQQHSQQFPPAHHPNAIPQQYHGQNYQPQAYQQQPIHQDSQINNQHAQQNHGVPPPAQYQQGAPPAGQYQQNVPPAAQYKQNVPPAGQYQQGAPPSGQYQQGVPPAGQYQQGAPPSGQYQQNVPPAGQYQQGAPPSGQYQQNVPPAAQYQQGAPPPSGQYQQGVPPAAQKNVPQNNGQVPQNPPGLASHQKNMNASPNGIGGAGDKQAPISYQNGVSSQKTNPGGPN